MPSAKYKYNILNNVLCKIPDPKSTVRRNEIIYISNSKYDAIRMVPQFGSDTLYNMLCYKTNLWGIDKLVTTYESVAVFEDLEIDSNLGFATYNPLNNIKK